MTLDLSFNRFKLSHVKVISDLTAVFIHAVLGLSDFKVHRDRNRKKESKQKKKNASD